jgi:hypothetical protein
MHLDLFYWRRTNDVLLTPILYSFKLRYRYNYVEAGQLYWDIESRACVRVPFCLLASMAQVLRVDLEDLFFPDEFRRM